MLDRYDQELLLDYLEGELDADRSAQLDAMLAEDPQLAALLNEMANDRAALRSMPHAEAPADLVHDVTQAMERQMLLDEPVEDLGPIPLSRGRAATVETTRSISWGRVVGLTGLAASVALVAGMLVITFDDPLERTANELAANTGTESGEIEGAAEFAADEEAIESFATRDGVEITPNEPAAEALAGADLPTVPDSVSDTEANRVARGVETPEWPGPNPGNPVAPELALPTEGAGGRLTDTLTVGTTAAISAFQPRQQLVLLSESPEVSLEQLFEFCIANGIPVVQPEQVSDSRALSKAGGNDKLAGDRPEEDEAGYGDYALLINDSQLDTLVQNLNETIALDPKRVGKGSLISNQAALVSDLPEDDLRYSAYGAPLGAGEDEADTIEERSEGFEEQAKLAQAVELRKPDLGSTYANTRNRYNLQQQQQASYGQREARLPDLALNEQFGAGEGTKPPLDENQAGLEKPDAEADLEAEVDSSEEAAELDDQAVPNAVPAPTENKAIEAIRSIDPSRGNWLSAHLPVADTTPLLLHWREGQADQPTRLVPVMIQRAEPERVNTLRQRQQVEYASRRKDAESQGEASNHAAAKSPATDLAEVEAAPAETEPAAPEEAAEE